MTDDDDVDDGDDDDERRTTGDDVDFLGSCHFSNVKKVSHLSESERCEWFLTLGRAGVARRLSPWEKGLRA
jgi:hypothetical protein